MDRKQLDERKKIIVQLINDPIYKPMKFKELANFLQVSKEDRHNLNVVLEELLKEGKIGISTKGKYGKPQSFGVYGIFEGNARGFGFVRLEGSEEDIFIPASETNSAFHKDKVQVLVLQGEQSGKKKEGKIIRVLERGYKEIIGTFQKNKNYGFVVPDNVKFHKDIFIPREKTLNARDGDKVVVKITDYGSDKRKPEGKVTNIIGHITDPGSDILSIAMSYELPIEFPQEVQKQLDTIPEEVSTKEMAGRMDIRSWQTVTIDGEDAKDLDDAITLTKKGDNYLLGVHIADVTHYVTENSPLDKEALKRGTSVYLVDRVIPMLPRKLSNGICSLNAGVDRLALSCIMEIDKKGTVIDHKIAETVIHVDKRMSYTNVKKILVDKEEELLEEYREFISMFSLMEELSGILRERRYQRGAIDFDFPEAKIYLDEKGKPIDIRPYERNVATKIIEDFMLLANETIAEDFFWQQIPFVYRVHDNPEEEKLQRFATFINNFGLSLHLSNGVIHPKELQKLLGKIEGTPEEPLISRLMLRSMKQAKYSTISTGHFGLSASYYCHFTSPIRRYPDLQIHRIIKENLKGGLSEKRISHYENILPEVCDSTSKTERRAEEAEREVEKLKKVQYMKKHLWQAYTGVISGITAHGMYVELPNTVEGFIHVNTLDGDYYTFVEETYSLVGQMTGKTYRLGEKVKIVVSGIDTYLKTIDFMLYNSWEKEEKEMEDIMNFVRKNY